MIEGIPIIDYTAEGLLGLVVVLIFAGILVPRWYIRRLEERINAQDRLIDELSKQNTEHLETTRLARSTWLALVKGAEDE